VASLESIGLFGQRHPSYFREPVESGHSHKAWFERALKVVADADLVFLDPDNGLARADTEAERHGSVKHALRSEIATLHAGGHAVLFSHHLNRSAGHGEQIRELKEELRRLLGVSVAAVRYRRGTARAFVAISGKGWRDLPNQVGRIRDSKWVTQHHFEIAGD
jgi:hypothetical protein